jgi:hypothetical protein
MILASTQGIPDMKSLLLATALAVASIMPAAAADMSIFAASVKKTNGPWFKTNIIVIQGKILDGDYNKFMALAAQTPNVTGAALQSSGGDLIEGLKIGEVIHEKHWNTFVYSDWACASVCGLMWLAGDRRFADSKSHIGFHAASETQTGRESGSGNAIVGAYMARLGYNYSAITWATTAPPNGIQWLNGEKASQLGITWQALVPETTP